MAHVIRVIRASMFFSTWSTDFTKCYNEKPTCVKSGDLGGHGACHQSQGIFQRKIYTRFWLLEKRVAKNHLGTNIFKKWEVKKLKFVRRRAFYVDSTNKSYAINVWSFNVCLQLYCIFNIKINSRYRQHAWTVILQRTRYKLWMVTTAFNSFWTTDEKT
jgi:hypothetical protein